MDGSMFSKASSSTRRLLSNSNYELPRWRSPSPMAASMIPPPIVQSTYTAPPSSSVQPVIIERPSPIQDRQSELEADLQFLLDAQAEGLLRGLEGGLPDDQTSTGSTTPTAQSVRSSSARRTLKSPRRRPGLRSARKGIYSAIRALSDLKDDELREVGDDLRQKEQKLEQLDEWEKKREGLREGTKHINSNEDTIRVQRLRQEADTLQEEINAVELQLADMKARHRKLTRQAAAVENSVQAKLASYTSSLRMLDEDVHKFLSLESTEGRDRPTSQDGKTSIWQLPPKRRTLEMARQQWCEERESTIQQRESVEYEKSALDEGAAVWKDVVSQISDFERQLRAEMSKLGSSHTPDAVEHPPSDDKSQKLEELVERMNGLSEHLESKFQLAKDRNWNLLIAAIGAELDALHQGKQLLENVLRPAAPSPQDIVDAAPSTELNSAAGDEIDELDKSFETARRRMSNGTDSDDPDPELLFSKHDEDTE